MPPSFNLAPSELHHTTAVQLQTSITTAPPLLTSIATPLHPQTPPPKTNPSTDRGCPNPYLLYFLSIRTGRIFFQVRFGGIFVGNEEQERGEKSNSRAGEKKRVGEKKGGRRRPGRRAWRCLPCFGRARAERGRFGSARAETRRARSAACSLARRLPTVAFRLAPCRNISFRQRPCQQRAIFQIVSKRVLYSKLRIKKILFKKKIP